jgi:hypothetical protein
MTKNGTRLLVVLLSISITGFSFQDSRQSVSETSYDARFKPLIGKLRNTEVPIRLPKSLEAFNRPGKPVFASLGEMKLDTYSIRIGSVEDCYFGYCFLGSISGERQTDENRQPLQEMADDREVVSLATGLKGSYGANPDSKEPSELLWQQNGALYRVSMYGPKYQLMQVANSMIMSAPISRSAVSAAHAEDLAKAKIQTKYDRFEDQTSVILWQTLALDSRYPVVAKDERIDFSLVATYKGKKAIPTDRFVLAVLRFRTDLGKQPPHLYLLMDSTRRTNGQTDWDLRRGVTKDGTYSEVRFDLSLGTLQSLAISDKVECRLGHSIEFHFTKANLRAVDEFIDELKASW